MNSEIEECINTITATMTKLRAHIRKLGMAGTKPECTCKHPDPTLHPDTEPDKLLLLDIKCPKHGKIIWLDKTPDLPAEPECTCPRHTWACHDPQPINIDCPLHGKHTWRKTPDLPLNARVAKALGHDIAFVSGGYYKMDNKDWPKPIFPWIDIPDYDKHRDLAMGALEEYCKQVGQPTHIVYNPDPVTSMGNKAFHVEINFKGRFGDTLPQAICEAIAKHAEGL